MTTDHPPPVWDAAEAPRRRSTLAAFDLLSPQGTWQRLNIAIAMAICMALAYALGAVIDLAKPPLPGSPVVFIKLVPIPFPAIWTATEVVIFVGWGIAAIAGVIGLALARAGSAGSPQVRACQVIVLGALLLPYAILPVNAIVANVGYLLLCVPTTAFGLWLVQRMQRFRKVPVRLLLTAFGWGALTAAGFSICMNGWFAHYAANFFLDFFDVNGMLTRLVTSMALNSGIFGELGKIAGIALLFVFFRRHFDSMVSGIAIGAAVGLGVNFTESLQYMNASGVALFNAGGTASQYWSHQILGLMASQVAFSAVAGAGFGVARQLREPAQRWLAVSCACLTAIAAHFDTDVIHPQFLFQRIRWSRDNPWLETLVAEPLVIAIISGPFVVLYLILLWRGHRSQADALFVQAAAEASTGLGAITAEETATILSPAARFFIRINALRNISAQVHRQVRSLQLAQLDLLTSRWHHARNETDPDATDESAHRQRVLALKQQLASATAPVSAGPRESTP